MNTPRDPDRLIHDFLMEGATELADPVYDAVRATIEQQRQRVVIGPRRTPIMNRFLPLGLGAAAIVVVAVVGAQLLGSSPNGGVGAPQPSPTVATTPTPTPSATPLRAPEGLTQGPFVVNGSDDPVRTTVSIASPGWFGLPDFDGVTKDDDGLDPPVSVGTALLAWAWPAGTGINVYGDPCHWTTTIPETPATTPDEIAAAFAAQSASDPTAPVDVTVGGFAGKAVTLRVPMTYDVPGSTREERFTECDNDVYAFYGIEGETAEKRNAQGAGQIDELWILDVDGAIVILDASYSPATPAELVDEVRALAGSATFE